MNKELFPSATKSSRILLKMPSSIPLLFTIAVTIALVDIHGIESHHLGAHKSPEDSLVSTTSENKTEIITRKVRNVIPFTQLRWPRGIVPYILDSSVAAYSSLILNSMNDIQLKTCITFIPRTAEKNYIKVFSGQGCYSNVGMVGGQQAVSLGQGCMYKGTIVHQLGHALGFYNEQNRSDRDNYLVINWDNIQAGMQSEFALLKPNENLLLENYDRNSAMLNGNNYMSKDGKSSTMVDKSGVKLLETYEKPGLSSTDVSALNKMYNC